MKNIKDYILLSKKERKSHITSDECILFKRKRAPNKNKVGQIPSYQVQMAEAKKNLLEYLDVENFKGCKIAHTCHTCNNHSHSGWVCVNPNHLYFGTPSENSLDRPKSLRKKSGGASVKSPVFMNKQTKQCKYCSFESNPGAVANHERACSNKS